MKRPTRYIGALVLALATATPAEAQLTLLNAAGYGAAGATAGVVATSGIDCSGSGFICIPGEMVVATIGGLLAGVVIGANLGGNASASLERGEAVDHLGPVVVGTVLGGATIGMMVGSAVAKSDEPAVFAFAGAALAALYLGSRWDEMTGAAFEVRPALVGGDAGLAARIRF